MFWTDTHTHTPNKHTRFRFFSLFFKCKLHSVILFGFTAVLLVDSYANYIDTVTYYFNHIRYKWKLKHCTMSIHVCYLPSVGCVCVCVWVAFAYMPCYNITWTSISILELGITDLVFQPFNYFFFLLHWLQLKSVTIHLQCLHQVSNGLSFWIVKWMDTCNPNGNMALNQIFQPDATHHANSLFISLYYFDFMLCLFVHILSLDRN